MVDFASTPISAVAAGTATGPRDSDTAALSQLEKCKHQLGDWQACPSGKTPEGQKIIENLQAQISRLETRVQQATPKAADRAETVKVKETVNPSEVSTAASTPAGAASGVGGGLDAWA